MCDKIFCCKDENMRTKRTKDYYKVQINHSKKNIHFIQREKKIDLKNCFNFRFFCIFQNYEKCKDSIKRKGGTTNVLLIKLVYTTNIRMLSLLFRKKEIM